MLVALSQIRTDGGTQSRAAIDPETVTGYADAMHDGAQFPPLVVFFDGATYWLADGFHRFYAVGKLGLSKCECDVRQGTQRDAILHSLGANATHGKPRTNADKRRAVLVLLGDEEWGKRSDNWIAERAAVSQPFVGKLRAEAPGYNGYNLDEPRAGKDGKSYTPPVKRPKPEPKPAQPPVVDEDEAEVEEARELFGPSASTPDEPPGKLDAETNALGEWFDSLPKKDRDGFAALAAKDKAEPVPVPPVGSLARSFASRYGLDAVRAAVEGYDRRGDGFIADLRALGKAWA